MCIAGKTFTLPPRTRNLVKLGIAWHERFFGGAQMRYGGVIGPVARMPAGRRGSIGRSPRLRNNRLDGLGRFHAGKFLVEPLKGKVQFVVVDAQLVEHGSV